MTSSGMHVAGTPASGRGAATHRPQPISQHRLLSDGRSMALITHRAEIDWWCWPREHSNPLCWSLLDDTGGTARWVGTGHAGRYGMPAGATARTELRFDDQVVEAWDGLVARKGTTELVRLVRNRDAELDLVHELGLGGFDGPWGVWSANRVYLDGDVVLWVVGGDTDVVDGWARTRVRAAQGEWAMVVVTPRDDVPALEAVVDRMSDLEDADRRRQEACAVPRHHADRVCAAQAVLHASTDRVTGAVIAAPTTSLPEAVGGDRQFDQRYAWLRDGALAVNVALLLGVPDVAGRYLTVLEDLGPEWLLDTPVRDADGNPVPPEREVKGVAGWFGSRPVRVGNAARDQLQFDVLGLVADAFYRHSRRTGRLTRRAWRTVSAVADRAAEPAGERSNGIWELRHPDDLVSADVGRWLALDRAIRIGRRHRSWRSRRRWRSARREARGRVLGAILPSGALPLTYGGDRVDASGLLLVVHGLFGARDRRAARLVDATVHALGSGPLLHRYPPDGADGFAAGEAPHVPASWWAVTALAIVGDPDGRRRADALCATLPVLLSEEYDPERGESLGNAPLVWAHAECARALFALDEHTTWFAWLRRATGRGTHA